MVGDVGMQYLTAAVLDDQEHVQDFKGGGDNNAKITGQQSLSVVTQKSGSALQRDVFPGGGCRPLRSIFPHGAWGHFDAKLER